MPAALWKGRWLPVWPADFGRCLLCPGSSASAQLSGCVAGRGCRLCRDDLSVAGVSALVPSRPGGTSGVKRIHVAAAVIRGVDGQILLAKRPDDKHQGGLWEFPGGKVEANETVQAALATGKLQI